MKNLVRRNQYFTLKGNRRLFFAALTMFFCIMLFMGCQHDALNLVTGKVTLDGTPISEGVISFMPSGTSDGVSTGAQIKNGAYSARVSPGKMVVKIYAERPLTPEEAAAINNNPMSGSSMTTEGEIKKQFIP